MLSESFKHRDLRFRRFRCLIVVFPRILGIGMEIFLFPDASGCSPGAFQASGFMILKIPVPHSYLSSDFGHRNYEFINSRCPKAVLSPYFVQSPASEGIIKPPLGERPTVPTAGPSGRQERLNCWVRKRFKNVPRHFSIKASS